MDVIFGPYGCVIHDKVNLQNKPINKTIGLVWVKKLYWGLEWPCRESSHVAGPPVNGATDAETRTQYLYNINCSSQLKTQEASQTAARYRYIPGPIKQLHYETQTQIYSQGCILWWICIWIVHVNHQKRDVNLNFHCVQKVTALVSVGVGSIYLWLTDQLVGVWLTAARQAVILISSS